MDKRYQVFISSTFWDLEEERQAVLKAILQLGHMPAGMELFPASDNEAWELIKDVIDTSDYYVLIIGGRYGSSDEAGIGYTEKEYDYAVENGRPVIAFLHKNPGDLPRNQTETGPAWEKLKKFRAKVEAKHLCKYWTSAEDLQVAVVLSLTSEVHRQSGVGWVRADQALSGEAAKTELELRKKNEELQRDLEALSSKGPEGIDDLESGEDKHALPYTVLDSRRGTVLFREEQSTTWNALFKLIGSLAYASGDTTNAGIRVRMESLVKEIQHSDEREVSIRQKDADAVILQLGALQLIRRSNRKNRWKLTPYGEKQLMQLAAIRRPPSPF